MAGRVVFATGNMGKMREIREILQDTGMEILSMKEAGVETDVEENGASFAENAMLKAQAVASLIRACAAENLADAVVLADDSGLVIDALHGEPGIYSARYLGEDTPYRVKSASLIERLAGVPDEKRTARFVCAIAAVLPDGETLATEGVIEGRIGYEEIGDNGFGYDPIFFLPEYGCTAAQLTEEQKNRISHRGRALEAMKAELQKRMP